MSTIWTLSEWEHNGYHDSDFFARLYDDATGHVYTKEVGTTRFPAPTSSPHPHITKAPADVQDRARKAIALAESATYRKLVTWDAEEAVNEPAFGRHVIVTRGRKVPPGTEGVIVWVGEDRYKSSRWATHWRFGLEVDGTGDRVFVNEDYVEVNDGLVVDYETIARNAEQVHNGVMTDPRWYHRDGARGIAPGGRPSPREAQRYLKAGA